MFKHTNISITANKTTEKRTPFFTSVLDHQLFCQVSTPLGFGQYTISAVAVYDEIGVRHINQLKNK